MCAGTPGAGARKRALGDTMNAIGRDGRSVLAQATASAARVDSAVPPAAPNSPDVRVSGE